jgi:hypothetical protein
MPWQQQPCSHNNIKEPRTDCRCQLLFTRVPITSLDGLKWLVTAGLKQIFRSKIIVKEVKFDRNHQWNDTHSVFLGRGRCTIVSFDY